VVRPKPRNPVLADAFKRIGLVERTGRGIDLIFEGQLRTGHRPPDYERSDETGVKEIEPARCEALVEQYVRTHGRITRAEAAEVCGLSPSQAYRLLRRLVDRGCSGRSGAGGVPIRALC
jgi:predicted HTH transcriptional regulator